MAKSAKVHVPWSDIDTLLLDMDGTLLDLAFDNHFWLDLVPLEFAKANGLSVDRARAEVEARYQPVIGTLPWYCLDHWTREFGLDLESLKRAWSHRIRYLPEAESFLRMARTRVARLILVTNAHRVTLAIKCEQTGVDGWMDIVVSSHDYGVEKERPEFWQRLAREHDVDPDRSLLLEDSLAVLTTARAFGIAHTIAITRPDTTLAERQVEDFPAVPGVASLLD